MLESPGSNLDISPYKSSGPTLNLIPDPSPGPLPGPNPSPSPDSILSQVLVQVLVQVLD